MGLVNGIVLAVLWRLGSCAQAVGVKVALGRIQLDGVLSDVDRSLDGPDQRLGTVQVTRAPLVGRQSPPVTESPRQKVVLPRIDWLGNREGGSLAAFPPFDGSGIPLLDGKKKWEPPSTTYGPSNEAAIPKAVEHEKKLGKDTEDDKHFQKKKALFCCGWTLGIGSFIVAMAMKTLLVEAKIPQPSPGGGARVVRRSMQIEAPPFVPKQPTGQTAPSESNEVSAEPASPPVTRPPPPVAAEAEVAPAALTSEEEVAPPVPAPKAAPKAATAPQHEGSDLEA